MGAVTFDGARALVWGALVLVLTGAGPRQKSWTLLFYVAGDETEIDRYSRLPIRKLEQVGSSADRWIIVQSDLSREEPTRRYAIEKHPGPMDVDDYRTLRIESPVVWESKGESNSASAASLSDYLRWGKAQYPAERYALFVLGHGWSWRGVPEDADPGFKIPQPPTGTDLGMWLLPLSEFGRALRENFSRRPLDLLVMDSCRMGVLEFFYELRGSVQQVLASPDEVPFFSFDYVRTLGSSERDRSGEDLGKRLLTDLLESFSRTGSQAPLEGDYSALSLGLWDLTRFEPFWEQWRELVQGLPPSPAAKIFASRRRSAFLDLQDNADLYELLEALDDAGEHRALPLKRLLWGDHRIRMPEETPFVVTAVARDRLTLRVQGDELLDRPTAVEKAKQIFGWLNPELVGWPQKWRAESGGKGERAIVVHLTVPQGAEPVVTVNPWIAGATWAELSVRNRGRGKFQRKQLSASYFVSEATGAAALRAVGHTAGAMRSRGLSVYLAQTVLKTEPQNHSFASDGSWLVGESFYRSLSYDRAFQWSRLIFNR